MRYLIGLVLVGCGAGIVGIQTFGDPAGWAEAVPADLAKLGLAAIAVLALTVGGMVLTPGTAAAEAPALPTPKASARLKLDESEVAEVLSLDDDEEAARRRARRAAQRKKARAAAARESGESPRRKTKTHSKTRTRAKHVRSYDDDEQPRPRTRKRSSKECARQRKREHAISGRN